MLVGQTQGQDFIGSSRAAFAALWTQLMAAKGRGEAITIEVQGGIPERPNNHEDVQEAIDPG